MFHAIQIFGNVKIPHLIKSYIKKLPVIQYRTHLFITKTISVIPDMNKKMQFETALEA